MDWVAPLEPPRCTLGYHNLLARAFCRLHGAPLEKTTAGGDLKLGGQESSEQVATADLLEAIENQEVYQKTMRIKAFKAYQWLATPCIVHDVLLVSTIMGPLEQCMYKFMAWQNEDAQLWELTSPVIEMTSARSPAVDAAMQLCYLMENDGRVRSSGALLANLAKGPEGHYLGALSAL